MEPDTINNPSKDVQDERFECDSIGIEPNEHRKLGKEKMTIFETMLALVATNIGGGIVGIPFALYNAGLILGVSAILIYGLIAMLATMLYLSTKDLSPARYESLYEIGYLLLGRWSIFMICGILYISNIGILVLYFVIFSDTASSIFRQLIVDNNLSTLESQEEYANLLKDKPLLTQVFCSTTTQVLLMAVLLIPVVYKKALEELKILSYFFLAAIVVLMALALSELLNSGRDVSEVT